MNDDIDLFRDAYASLVDAAPAPPDFERLESPRLVRRASGRQLGWKAAVAGFAVTMIAIGGVGVFGRPDFGATFGAGTTTTSAATIPVATSVPVGAATGFYVSDHVPDGFVADPGSSSGLAATHDGEVALLQGGFGASGDAEVAVVAVPGGAGRAWIDDVPGEVDGVEANRSVNGVDLVAVGRGLSQGELEAFLSEVDASMDDGVAGFSHIPALGDEPASVWSLASNPDWLSQTSYTSGGSSLAVGTVTGAGQGVFHAVRIGDGRWDPIDGEFAVPDFMLTFDAGDYTVIATGIDVSEQEFLEFYSGIRPVGVGEWQETVGIEELSPRPDRQGGIVVASGDWWTLLAEEVAGSGQPEGEDGSGDESTTCYWFEVDPLVSLSQDALSGWQCHRSDNDNLWVSVGPAIQSPTSTVILAALGTEPIATMRVSFESSDTSVEPAVMPDTGVQFAAVEVPADWPSATVELLDDSGAVLDTIELDSLTPGG